MIKQNKKDYIVFIINIKIEELNKRNREGK